MNPAVRDRIQSASTSLGWYESLEDAAVQAAIASALDAKRSSHYSQLATHSIRDDRPDGVRQRLREFPVGAGDQVMVLWPALRSGISATYHGFVNAYDDLWLPGADDVWVRPAAGEWLLELDHEEVLRFYKHSRKAP